MILWLWFGEGHGICSPKSRGPGGGAFESWLGTWWRLIRKTVASVRSIRAYRNARIDGKRAVSR